jgi:hypothetical protein
MLVANCATVGDELAGLQTCFAIAARVLRDLARHLVFSREGLWLMWRRS